DIQAQKVGCQAGTVSVTNVPVTNPGSVGSYTITWSNDNGSGEVYIVDDDQVTINANVEQTMVFDLNLGTASTDTSSAPYTLDLGILSPTLAIGSDDSLQDGIWVDIGTNASSGVVITVKSANSALQSSSVPTDEIASGAVADTTEGYGICVASGGNGIPNATEGTLTADAAFDYGSCSATAWDVGTLTGSTQTIFTSGSAPIFEGQAQIRVAASISSTTPAHDDYADTLTFIATATY
ncbi:hypothetical protein KKG19_01925, partial [Patescibacteria group bacterium]|nr:hypothetical protein [Patescibacteria group bacterium]